MAENISFRILSIIDLTESAFLGTRKIRRIIGHGSSVFLEVIAKRLTSRPRYYAIGTGTASDHKATNLPHANALLNCLDAIPLAEETDEMTRRLPACRPGLPVRQ